MGEVYLCINPKEGGWMPYPFQSRVLAEKYLLKHFPYFSGQVEEYVHKMRIRKE